MRLRKATAGAVAGLAVLTCGALVAQTVPAASSQAHQAATLSADVGQLVVLGFEGSSPPAWLRSLLRRRAAAGVILFGANVRSRDQLRALTASLQRAARGAAIVSVDQEGGTVRRVPWLGPSGQPAQHSAGRARREAVAAGRGLKRAGVNLNLAPVADVAVGPSAMRSRAFPGGPASVASLAAAAVRGYNAAGVGSTAKHFPGFGRARANTDQRAVTIGASRRALERDLRPFGAAIRAGVPAVMVSHAVYPAYDRGRIASQSPVLIGLLRQRLGFRGAVLTDSLDAAAVQARSSTGTAAVRSIAAGADLLLVGGPSGYQQAHSRLLAAARRSPRLRARVADAAGHVRELKARLGLRAP
jgi:beta-N-acetylhexosaminidase